MKNSKFKKELSDLFDTRNISHVARYATSPVIIKQSVAEHSYNVALLCMFLRDQLERARLLLARIDIPQFNTSYFLMLALLHDMSEGFTGDILYPIKPLVANMEHVERSVLKSKLLNGHPLLKYYTGGYLVDRLEATDVESVLVHFCDTLELTMYCIEEQLRGNTFLQEPLTVGTKSLFGYIEKYPWLKIPWTTNLIKQIKGFIL